MVSSCTGLIVFSCCFVWCVCYLFASWGWLSLVVSFVSCLDFGLAVIVARLGWY